MRIVVAITGASGALYARGLLEHLSDTSNVTTDLVMSVDGLKLMEYEVGLGRGDIECLADTVHDNANLAASIASGSCRFDAMVIVPCTANTFCKVAAGIADNLISRTASNCLKEERKLIIVARETPLSLVQLRALTTLSEAGATIMPASPAFYHLPEGLDGLADFMVGRILDALDLPHDLFPRWDGY